MRRFDALKNANDYLEELTVPGASVIRCVNQGDATTKLANAVGNQVVAARPEEYLHDFAPTLSLAFFVLAKNPGSSMTAQREDEKFAELLEIADSLIGQLENAADHSCRYFAGLGVNSINIVPELSIFGGWFGYSIDVTLT